MRPAPRLWSFVERSKPTILLDEQDKPDVTHIHRRANDVPTHGTALMASESPRVEQKPYHGDNQITVMINIASRTSVHIKDPHNLGIRPGKGWCAVSVKNSSSCRLWNLRTRRVVEARNVIFTETPPHLILQPLQLSPLQGRQPPPLDFTEDTFDDN